MGSHLIDGQFQSDKYPTTPRNCVPLKVTDKTAQDLLWEYAQRRRSVDAEFSADLETALSIAGFVVPLPGDAREIELLREAVKTLGANCDEETGQPQGTFAGQQFAAIDRELYR